MTAIIGTIGIFLLTLFGVLYSLLGYNMYFQTRFVEFMSAKAEKEGMKSEHTLKGERIFVKREEKRSSRVNLYRHGDEPLPVLYVLHGGSFTDQDADDIDSFCDEMALRVKAAVISISYTKMPVHTTTYPQEEITEVVQYFHAHAKEYGLDHDRYVMLGIEAGGYLALLSAVMLVRRTLVPDGLILLDPFADYVGTSFVQAGYHPGPAALLISGPREQDKKLMEYADVLSNGNVRSFIRRLFTKSELNTLIRGESLSEEQKKEREVLMDLLIDLFERMV